MSTTGPSLVTTEAPWLGLRAFTEDLRPYFFGRDRELDDLFERVAQKPLTVLFGQSGLGKTSLIQAALLPRLHHAGFVRVLLRLDHGDAAPPLEQQLLRAVQAAVDSAVVSMPNDDLPAPLWRLLHDPAYGLCREGAPRVVLMLDQFEEIFTLGESNPTRRAASRTFLHALAEVVENRVPAVLRSILEEDEALADRIDFGARPLKLLISLREDFLHRLERWRAQMPSLMDNRLELRLLTGPQALQAVVEPGKLRCAARPELPPIVSEATGAAIVRFVADVEDDVPLAEIDAVPPLLSLLCAELNAQRGDSPTIRAEQIEGRAEDILHEFYERCFAPHPVAVRRFVEDRLLSPEGFRQNANQDTFLHEMEHAGITDADARAILGKLVDDRLIISEERAGIHRIELTHDTLTGVARTSRDQRLEREEKERAERELEIATKRNRVRRMVMSAMVLLTLAAGAGLWWALRQRSVARASLANELAARNERIKTLADTNYLVATYASDQGKTDDSLNHLASALEYNPSHPGASVFAADKLDRASMELQLFPHTIHRAEGNTLKLDVRHRFAATHDESSLIVRDPFTWKELFRSPAWGRIQWHGFDERGTRLLANGEDGVLHVIELGEAPTFNVTDFRSGGQMTGAVLSGDGSTGAAIVVGWAKSSALIDVRQENEVLRFFYKNDSKVTSVRSVGHVQALRLTEDGHVGIALMSRPEGLHGVVRGYDTRSGAMIWEIEDESEWGIAITLRADGQVMVVTQGRVFALDAGTGQIWLSERRVEKMHYRFSPDGMWGLLARDDAPALVYLPKPDSAEMSKGIHVLDWGLEITESNNGAFTPDSSTLVTQSYSRLGRTSAFRIVTLDAAKARRGEDLEVVTLEDIKGRIMMHSWRSDTFSVWGDSSSESASPQVLTWDAAAHKWSSWQSKIDIHGYYVSRVTEPVGAEGCMLFDSDKVYAEQDRRQAVLQESGPVLAAWQQGDSWVSVIDSHVALWPLHLVHAKPSEPAGGRAPHADDRRGKIDARLSDSWSVTLVRPLADGRYLWVNRGDYSAHTADQWGLTDAGKQWIPFATPESKGSEKNSWATCTMDGSRLFVGRRLESGAQHLMLEAWDTTQAQPTKLPTLPEGSRAIALHPTLPRVLLLDGSERCIDFDLSTGRVHATLSRLPRPNIAVGTALPLHDDHSWMVPCAVDDQNVVIVLADEAHETASILTAPHRLGYDDLAPLKLYESRSGRYRAASGTTYQEHWLWCATTEGRVVFEGTLGKNIRLPTDWVHDMGFDEEEHFLAYNESYETPTTLNLRTGDVFPVSLALATQASSVPTPSWLPSFLRLQADQRAPTFVTREEAAQRLGVTYPSDELFARYAQTWLGPMALNELSTPDAATTAQDEDRELNELRGAVKSSPEDFLVLRQLFEHEEKKGRSADAAATLQRMLEVCQAELARGHGDWIYKARLGGCLLHKGDFAEAVAALKEADAEFPEQATHPSNLAARQSLHKHLAYALWLAGQPDEASRVARDRRFHDWLWNGTSPLQFTIYKDGKAEAVDVDRELRENTRPSRETKARQKEEASVTERLDHARQRVRSALLRAHLTRDEEAARHLREARRALADAFALTDTAGHFEDFMYQFTISTGMGDAADAQAALTQAAAIEASGTKVSDTDKAHLREAQGRLDEALALWTKVAQAKTVYWSTTSLAAAFARKMGRYDLAREWLNEVHTYLAAQPEPRYGQGTLPPAETIFHRVLDGWLAFENHEDDDALDRWEEASERFKTHGADPSTVRKTFAPADWLPGLIALTNAVDPVRAEAYMRDLLRLRPELALPGALDGDIVLDPWYWSDDVVLHHPPTKRLGELRAALKAVQQRLPEDERIAAETAGLLSLYRLEEAMNILPPAAARFTDSPWIALQMAAVARMEHDVPAGLQAWTTALKCFARRDREGSKDDSLLGRRQHDRSGRPSLEDVLAFARNAVNHEQRDGITTLLDLAETCLDGGVVQESTGWVRLALSADDARKAFLQTIERARDREDLADDDKERNRWASLRRDAEQGFKISAAFQHYGTVKPLVTLLALAEPLPYPNEGFANWQEKLTEWKAPEAVQKQLTAIIDAAKAMPVPELLRVLQEHQQESYQQVQWLRVLGHADAAIDIKLRDPTLTPIDKASLLLERDTPALRQAAIAALQEAQLTTGADDELQRRLLLGSALHREGRSREAFELLAGLFADAGSKRILEGGSEHADKFFDLINTLATNLGEALRALPWLQETCRRWRGRDAVALRGGWLALAQGDNKAALEFFEDCTGKDLQETALIGSAIALAHQGNQEEALRFYAQFLEQGDSSWADADYHPKGVADHLLPDVRDLNAAFRAAGAEGFHRLIGDYGTAQGLVWQSDIFERLGFHEEAIDAARKSLDRLTSDNTAQRAKGCYHLAMKMRNHPVRGQELAVEAEGYAREAARLEPDKSSYWIEWVKALCAIKKIDAVPAAFHHALNLDDTNASDVHDLVNSAFLAGSLSLIDELRQHATAARKKQMLPAWLQCHVDAHEYKRALDIANQQADDLNAGDLAEIRAYAKAGLGRLDEAVNDYLAVLSTKVNEADNDFAKETGEWRVLHQKVRDAFIHAPGDRLLTYARSLTDRARLQNFSAALNTLKRGADALPVRDLLLSEQIDNRSGTTLSIFSALICLNQITPPDTVRALHYLEKPQWTLKGGELSMSAFELDDDSDLNLDMLTYVGLQLGISEVVRRCVEIEITALKESKIRILEDYALEHAGDAKGADECFALNLQRFGHTPEVLLNRAMVLLHRGDATAAEALFQQLLATRQLANTAVSSSDWRMHGAFLMKLGKESEAIEAMRQSIRLDSESAASDYYTRNGQDGSFWPTCEREVLEPLRVATLAKYPDLVPKAKDTAKKE